MSDNSVSFVVPFYNVEKYLEECLHSLNTYPNTNKEIILVNDGATDNSPAIAEKFRQQFPDYVKVISVFNDGVNAVGTARNAGLNIAVGKFVFFIDSDDIIDGTAIPEMIRIAETENADIVVADFYEFYENSDKKLYRYDKSDFKVPLIAEEDRLGKLFNISVSFSVWNKIYRRSFLTENNLRYIEGYWFEDLDFVFQTFYKAKKISKANKVFYGYRQRISGSVVSSISHRTADKLEILDRLVSFLKAEGKFTKYQSQFNILYLKIAFSILYASLKNRADKKLSTEIIKALLTRPYFREITRSSIKLDGLSTKEKLFYYSIKYGIINTSTLRLAMSIL